MSKFNRTTDDIAESGFISKNKILEYVSQADIFQLVFGFKPVEFDYVCSPFREDTSPGCWFEIDLNTNKLRFTDFADTRVINGVKMSNIDCFDSVMVYFGLPNFYKTLEFIKAKLIDGREIKHDIVHKIYIKPEKRLKKKVKILMNTRDFYLIDRNFWELRYKITKENLIEDKVFPIRKFKLFDTKTGDHMFRTDDIAYAYTEFESGNKKIYRPKKKDNRRFITNCDAEDVGGMNSNITSGRLLIITKSYKDFRVLKNLGLNVRWLQNEGMFPKNKKFWDLVNSFDKIIVLFDNDPAGIKAAQDLVELINFPSLNRARSVHLPIDLLSKGISDPSDLIHKRNEQELINFLKSNRILL
tara:strand:+ start:7775 stop:8845 length:1071 start_codon:yes stop_codon:yes gene_type:complete